MLRNTAKGKGGRSRLWRVIDTTCSNMLSRERTEKRGGASGEGMGKTVHGGTLLVRTNRTARAARE